MLASRMERRVGGICCFTIADDVSFPHVYMLLSGGPASSCLGLPDWDTGGGDLLFYYC